MKDITDIFENSIKESSYSKSSGILRNVAIMSTNKSDNGRIYTENSMKKIADFIGKGGIKMFLDHPSRQEVSEGGVRSIRDFGGMFANGSYSNNKVTADLKVAPNHQGLVESLKEMNAPVGFSINAKALVRDKDGLESCEDIKLLRSVDLVSSPALNTTIMEHFDGIEEKKQTVEEATQEFLGDTPLDQDEQQARDNFTDTLRR